MFSTLSDRLSKVFDQLKRRGVLSEPDVMTALREIRIALLEADVALPVVKEFIEQVQKKAVGQEVLKSITPGQMVVKIVHDELMYVLGEESVGLNLQGSSPLVVMMVGLQGSGKTTSTVKVAKFVSEKYGKKVLLASTDVYRPAAREQLEILGRQGGIDTLEILEGDSPSQITERALAKAKNDRVDILFLDTAGRLHVNDALMDELVEMRQLVGPTEILLVADAMTGQDALTVARKFHDRLGLTGILLSRVDGDARGGAALSMRSVTGCPIKFVGVGEKIDQIEPFHPARIADRILGMGDVVTLVEKAAETFEQEEAEKLAEKLHQGQFDLDDLASQLKKLSKMGGLATLVNLLPGMTQAKDRLKESGFNDKMIGRQLAILSSMTPYERRHPRIFDGSRKRRVAAGSGTQVQDVNLLLKQHLQMQDMLKRLGRMGEKGVKRNGLKGILGSHRKFR